MNLEPDAITSLIRWACLIMATCHFSVVTTEYYFRPHWFCACGQQVSRYQRWRHQNGRQCWHSQHS